MSLQPGTRLHHYEILEAIGAGGMGEVCRARDGNLERDVAIKVLPRGMADNRLNLVRLEREARPSPPCPTPISCPSSISELTRTPPIS